MATKASHSLILDRIGCCDARPGNVILTQSFPVVHLAAARVAVFPFHKVQDPTNRSLNLSHGTRILEHSMFFDTCSHDVPVTSADADICYLDVPRVRPTTGARCCPPPQAALPTHQPRRDLIVLAMHVGDARAAASSMQIRPPV